MTNQSPTFDDPNVEAAFLAFPADVRPSLLTLRDLIFQVSADHPETGALLETLKWGQPAYLTPETKSGSTIRLGVAKSGEVAMFTHCQTTIMSDFQALFPDDFTFDGNRAIHLQAGEMPTDKLRLLIASALRYHLKRDR